MVENTQYLFRQKMFTKFKYWKLVIYYLPWCFSTAQEKLTKTIIVEVNVHFK